MKKNIIIKNRKKKASSVVFIIFFIVIFLAFAAFAVDGTIIFTNRVKLQNKTEMAAMAAAAEFNSSSTITASDIQKVATSTFKLLVADGLQHSKIVAKNGQDIDTANGVIDNDVVVDTNAKKVTLYTSVIAEPFFLTYMGVTGVKLEAKACAISEPLSVNANYSGVNWLTASAAYLSDILSKNSNMNDTAILQPLGNVGAGSASYGKLGYPDFSLLNPATDNKPLSLGPGGFITIKLPAPIIDKTGPDLFIKEYGTLEGYMVFAGLDNNPMKPYVNPDNRGDEISWVNITCSAKPESNGPNTVYNISTDSLGYQNKFYGSAYFDIGASCTSGLSMAKYIRIVDDNTENGFVTTDKTSYYKAMLYGEASTATPGADIDYVTVLNHVRLIATD